MTILLLNHQCVVLLCLNVNLMELVPTKELNSKILIIFLQICLDVNKDVIVRMEKSNVKMPAGKKGFLLIQHVFLVVL